MPTKSKAEKSTTGLEFYDGSTIETTLPLAPVVFYDDFVNTTGLCIATNGAVWGTIDTGAATEAAVADTANGVVALTLTSGSEKQEAGIDFNDQRCWVPGQGLIFEARVCLSVTPTGTAEGTWGLASDYAEAGDNIANNAWFKVVGSTAILCESDDGTTDVDDTATGSVTATGTYNIYKIDASDAADVKFYIDGTRVCASTTFALAAATLVQPFFYMYKASGTDVGTMSIDYVRLWQKRS